MLSGHPGPHFITTAEAQPLSSSCNIISNAILPKLSSNIFVSFQLFMLPKQYFFSNALKLDTLRLHVLHPSSSISRHPNPLNPFMQGSRSRASSNCSTYNTQCISYTSLHTHFLCPSRGKVESDRRNDQLTADKVGEFVCHLHFLPGNIRHTGGLSCTGKGDFHLFSQLSQKPVTAQQYEPLKHIKQSCKAFSL